MSTAVPSPLPTDDPWRRAFVLRLRLLDVVGTSIGDALAVVETHCRESGETPPEAFGDPDDYARAVAAAFTPGERVTPTRWWGAALLGGGSGLGIMALFSGASGLRAGTAELTTGDLVAIVVMALVGAALPSVLGVLIEHRYGVLLFGGLWGVGFLGSALAKLLWTTDLFVLPAWLLLAIGAVVLVASWAPSLRRGSADPVIDPRTGLDRYPMPGWGRVVWFGPPVVLVVAVVLFAVLS